MMDERIIRVFGKRAKYLTDGEVKAVKEVFDYEASNGPISGSFVGVYEMGRVINAIDSVLRSEFCTTMHDVMSGGRTRGILYLRYCVLVSICRLTRASDREVVTATGNHIDRSTMIHVRKSFDDQMMYCDFSEKYFKIFDGAVAILRRDSEHLC